ncbi:hypothetical protein SB748_28845 [Rhizobium sp. SIMBA_035]
MTYDIEIQIEELRAELRKACDAGERRLIETELEAAQEELAEKKAAFEALVSEEPPR